MGWGGRVGVSASRPRPKILPRRAQPGLSRWRIPCYTVAYGCRTIDYNQLRAYCMVSQHAGPRKSDFPDFWKIMGFHRISIGIPYFSAENLRWSTAGCVCGTIFLSRCAQTLCANGLVWYTVSPGRILSKSGRKLPEPAQSFESFELK